MRSIRRSDFLLVIYAGSVTTSEYLAVYAPFRFFTTCHTVCLQFASTSTLDLFFTFGSFGLMICSQEKGLGSKRGNIQVGTLLT